MNTDDEEQGEPSPSISRREFLKIAGLAGATIGVGASLGGLLAACGDGEVTTTSAAASTRQSPCAPCLPGLSISGNPSPLTCSHPCDTTEPARTENSILPKGSICAKRALLSGHP